MATQKKRPQLSSEEVTIECYKIDQRHRTGRTFIVASVVVYGLYQAEDILSALAGKETVVSFVTKFLLESGSGISISVLLILLASAVGWGLVERRLRENVIERLSSRLSKLETVIDPERSTSGLTPRGTTRPEDL